MARLYAIVSWPRSWPRNSVLFTPLSTHYSACLQSFLSLNNSNRNGMGRIQPNIISYRGSVNDISSGANWCNIILFSTTFSKTIRFESRPVSNKYFICPGPACPTCIEICMHIKRSGPFWNIRARSLKYSENWTANLNVY